MSEWREMPIGELMAEFHDGPHATPKPSADGPVFLGIKNLTDAGNLDLSAVRHIAPIDFTRWTKRVTPQQDDIVFTYEATLHRYALIPRGFHGCLGRRLALIRPHLNRADPRYLHQALRSPAWRSTVEERVISGATVDRIPLIDFQSFPIRVPSLGTQRRIAAVLAAFDELIAINERRIELLEDLARSLYREWFVRFRFPGHGDAAHHDSVHGGVPSGWDVARLGDVATLRYGRALPAKSRRPGTVAVVSSAGVIDEHDEALVETPGIVLGRKGNVGSVWWVDRPYFPIDTTYYVESDMPIALLYWQLRNMAFIDSHAAVPGLSREQAYGLPVTVPPEALARRFDSTHRACFDSMSGLRSTNAALARTRDLLLPRLVTGRLDITDIDLGDLLPAQSDA